MTTKSAGRPKDHSKSEAMVLAATEVFLARGFAATTVEAVAELAGVSKVTIYARFKDKAGLFEAMVKHVSDQMQADVVGRDETSHSLEDILISFGKGLLAQLMSPRLIAFDRNLAGDLTHYPDLAKRFYEAGPAHVQKQLASIIADANQRGELRVDDSMTASADLHGLWCGFHMLETRYGLSEPPTADKIDTIVRSGVALFLRAYSPAP
jgi:TetR/AcrR family transcriptional regulator, mexJK operon transcriptional repressor